MVKILMPFLNNDIDSFELYFTRLEILFGYNLIYANIQKSHSFGLHTTYLLGGE